MQITLDFHGKTPIYTQIFEQVERLVATGALKPSDQLPTVRELAADLRVNFNTVARAYRLLHEARIISTQQGRGTYVLEQPPPVDVGVTRVRRLMEMVEAWLTEAERSGFAPEEVAAAWQETLIAWRKHKLSDTTHHRNP